MVWWREWAYRNTSSRHFVFHLLISTTASHSAAAGLLIAIVSIFTTSTFLIVSIIHAQETPETLCSYSSTATSCKTFNYCQETQHKCFLSKHSLVFPSTKTRRKMKTTGVITCDGHSSKFLSCFSDWEMKETASNFYSEALKILRWIQTNSISKTVTTVEEDMKKAKLGLLLDRRRTGG